MKAIWAKGIKRLRGWGRSLKALALTLWFAGRDPAMPWGPKLLCALAVGYALSPIDLIPDFIPILGLLDDLLLLPALLWLAARWAPTEVITRAQGLARDWVAQRKPWPVSRAAGIAVAGLWGLGALGLMAWVLTLS